MPIQLGFDIGGTFTDIARFESTTGLRVFKTLTTPDNPASGALTGIGEFLAADELQLAAIERIVHATTLVANALIERKGARVALLTTAGFRDILEIGVEQRYDIYDLFLRYPPPLCPRHLRRGISERVDRDGVVLQPVDVAAVRSVVAELRAQNVEAIAVCFLHAYRNPANEQAALAAIRKEWPEALVSLSSTVAPEIREYERTSTTVANAYVQPLLQRYLQLLETKLREGGFSGAFFPMFSSGKSAPLSAAMEQPIRLVESGPAAGAIAAGYFGRQAGHENVLAFDMGGTTAKLSLITAGEPSIAPNLEVARIHRFKKGSGLPLQFPTVDMLEIGAGGGSIARIDALGLLKIGPESAGAAPGPACYGLGGTRPTVTDADLLLGYLNPGYFLGGKMTLSLDAARAALGQLAEPFDDNPIAAADAVHRLVNENMAAAAKIHVLEQGRDPRRFALVCFGGAGPVHAAGVGRILGLEEVIVPPNAGVASAIGLLLAPVAFDFVRSYPLLLDGADWQEIEEILQAMERQGLALLAEAGIDPQEATIQRQADGRFAGQLHEISLPLPGMLSTMANADFRSSFLTAYEKLYHHLPSDMPIELLTWRVTVSGPPMALPALPTPPLTSSRQPGVKGTRPVYFHEAGDFLPTPVYDRYALRAGAQVAGPAIIEERESTVVVRPEMAVAVDDALNLHIQLRYDR